MENILRLSNLDLHFPKNFVKDFLLMNLEELINYFFIIFLLK